MTQRTTLRALVACCGILLAACEPTDLVLNPLVDRWCGDRPCGWDVDGRIARVGTWHENDYAVALLSDGVRLSQANPRVDASVPCLDFSMIAKVGKDADVYVEMDFLDDGKVEFSERLRPTDYEPIAFTVAAPTWYEGVRFIVRKAGRGEAVLAKLRVREGNNCTGDPIELLDRPKGSYCERDEECATGLCAEDVCAGCKTTDDCAGDQVCGYTVLEDTRTRDCVEPESVSLGGACPGDEVCASGICCDGTCSECCADGDCSGDAKCDYPQSSKDNLSYAPKLCAPNAGLRLRGEACIDDDDCESAICVGAETGCAYDPCGDDDESCIPLCLEIRATPGECD